jgi:hypothetical protein
LLTTTRGARSDALHEVAGKVAGPIAVKQNRIVIRMRRDDAIAMGVLFRMKVLYDVHQSEASVICCSMTIFKTVA